MQSRWLLAAREINYIPSLSVDAVERAMLYAAILVAGLALSSAYRVDHQLDRKLVTQPAQLAAPGPLGRCQYSAAPSAVESGRPYHDSLVALCPNNSLTEKCVKEAKSSAAMVLVVDTDVLGVGNCESLCNENYGMVYDENHFYRRLKFCKGYVVRHPFNEGIEKGKAQCWLIHGDARMSKTFKSEVKIERSTLLDGRNNKITHHKEFCGCEARVVHFPRPAFRTELALQRHKLAQLTKELSVTFAPDKDSERLMVKAKVQKLELQEVDYQRLNALEGVYDWLPIRVPHRVAKKEERFLPGAMARFFKPGLIKNQAGSWKRYWSAPVRMSKIYKNALSAFLYLCLNKSSMEENWYLTKRDDMITWAGKTFRHLRNQSEENITDRLSNEQFLQKVFFRMECTGTKIGRDNKVTYKVKDKTTTGMVDRKFLHGEDLPPADSSETMTLMPWGCYENAKQAQDAVEEQVQFEVGRCPIKELSTSQKGSEGKITFLSMFSSDSGAMGGLNKAKYVIDMLKSSVTVTKWLSKGYSWWTGKKSTGVKQLHEYDNENIETMMERTTVLIGAISKLWLVFEAAGNTEDLEIKSVCAKEVLDQIFEVGGLMPKVSQNLAMRPDLVKDDFIRNKLKETQNANPSRDMKGTMQYLSMHDPLVFLPGIRKKVRLMELLEYEKALSAGSVGQVDLFTLKEDIAEEWKTSFKKLLPAGHGDTVIVKTVFEETERAYENDWALLELFFTNCGDNCDAKMRVMWKILEPMKKSIFDEFDLRDEATFTAKGKAMLAEFTEAIQEGEYEPMLKPGDLVLTTPNAIATTSKYFLIQSIASGTPLKNFLEDSGSQIEQLVDWKQKIYSAILMVYGHMVVKHGFFQSDPHNGNWFWEPNSKTVTLIDWGGVGDLGPDTHCKLANLYSHLGKLTKAWSDCEAVELQTVELKGIQEVSGTYHRAGFSIYQATENQTALFYGRTYGISYFNEELGLRLFYNDDGKWNVVREHPGTQALTETVAELETKVTDMMELSHEVPEKWSFMNKKGKVVKKKTVVVSKKDPKSCHLPTRSQAYSLAAYKMGLGLNFACKAEDTVVIPEAPLSEDEDAMSKWEDNGKRQLGCIRTTEEETFLEWGLYAKLKLIVETKNGKHNKTYDLDEEPKDVDVEGWVIDAFNEESRMKIGNLSKGQQRMLLSAAQSQLAVATSLYDSDILMAAVLGLQAKGSVGLITPDVPDEYVLLARCIVVFHGMLGDVLKDNFVRFMVTGQQDYIQWLVRSGGDRFFRSWMRPAEDAAKEGKCPTKDWKALEIPKS